MRLVKQEANGRIHVTLNRREMAMRSQIAEMLRRFNMEWDYNNLEFCGEPPWGYKQMKGEVMHDIREYRRFFYVINIKCIRSNEFNFSANVIGDRYNLYVSDSEKVYYAGSYFTDWFEQYFIDNTNVLERWGHEIN